jgi:small subunit ribosomal protein S12
MLTRNQYVTNPRKRKKRRNVVPALLGNPHKRAHVIKAITRSPKKPNSAKRKVVKAVLGVRFKGRRILKTVRMEAYIPGEGHNLQTHNNVLLKGGRIPDLPGVRYRCVRGALDLDGVQGRKKARSRYGTKNLARMQKVTAKYT